jgi:hypothetical protein
MSNIFNHRDMLEKKLTLGNIEAIGNSAISEKCDTIGGRFLAAAGERTQS